MEHWLCNGKFDFSCIIDGLIASQALSHISTSFQDSKAQNPSRMVRTQDPEIIANLHHRY
jgi:hypothetical protein